MSVDDQAAAEDERTRIVTWLTECRNATKHLGPAWNALDKAIAGVLANKHHPAFLAASQVGRVLDDAIAVHGLPAVTEAVERWAAAAKKR